MKLSVVEHDYRKKDKHFESTASPLTYRVSLQISGYDDIVLTREYFYVGYNSGEKYDKFYFDDYRDNGKLTRGSFITTNFDSDYLVKKESELIKKFYKKLINSIKK